MDISAMHFEGATIVRAIEEADQRKLIFELSYPLTEPDTDFRRGKLIFWFCSRYLVDERDINGEPAIQSASVIETDPGRVLIRIRTSHGIREVTSSACRKLPLDPPANAGTFALNFRAPGAQ